MKRRHFLIGMAGAGLAAAFFLKPEDGGADYSPYFRDLNTELKRNGFYRPQLIVDLERLDKNIEALQKGFDPDTGYRVVAKSLPCPELLAYVMEKTASRRLMAFHQPFINHMAEAFPENEILLGKPMPVESAHRFYQSLPGETPFDPGRQLQWLIDTPLRLAQYQELAQALDLRMRVNIEIDIGLHRGGVSRPDEFLDMMNRIQSDPGHLALTGLMGYDPHVVKIPGILKSSDDAYRESQTAYQEYLQLIREHHPQIDIDTLCLNGAGSPTLELHKQGTVANELSAGSCLVKPTDFDLPSLQAYSPAAYIATPVLKKLSSTRIPAIESFGEILNWWDPNTKQSFFIYGGRWMARYESPPGLQDNPLYGPSTNQHLINGSDRIKLEVDDHIFLRPTQSEFVFLQFGDLLTVRNGKIEDQWSVFGQA